MRLPTWTGDWALPKRVVLPGCRVRVLVVPRTEIAGEADATWTYKHEDSGKGYAVVRIAKDLPLPVQRYCLLHELQHASVEVLDVMLEKYLEHVHTKNIALAVTEEVPA